RAGAAVAGNECGSDGRQKQRLVAEPVRGLGAILDPGGPRFAAPVAAREKCRLLAALDQQAGQRPGERRFAGASGREIAAAKPRQARAVRYLSAEARGCDPAVKGGERGEQTAARIVRLTVPPGRLLKKHASISRPEEGAGAPPPSFAAPPRAWRAP